MYERFVDLVADGRQMSKSSVKAAADGRLFSATQAKALGLVDTIGYQDELLKAIRSKHEGKLTLVEYRTQMSFVESLAGGRGPSVLEEWLRGQISLANQPAFLFVP